MKTLKLYFFCLTALFLFATEAAKGESKNWPREIESNDGDITIFQPSVESLTNDMMEARSAIIVETEDDGKIFGAIWYKSRISTDRNERTVTLLDMTIEANKFPGLGDETISKIDSYIETEIPKWQIVMSLDEILTGLENNELVNTESEQINNDAPEIIFATSPTALVSIDGEPIYQSIEGSTIEYVLNTPFFIARDINTNRYYLKGGNYWYVTNDIYGDWKATETIPSSLKLIEEQNAEDIENSALEEESNLSKILVRTSPAELLVSNGLPKYASVKNTGLLYMTNTDDDILMDITDQNYYILVSGRWYRSNDLYSNNWTFVAPDALPEDFYKIPDNSPVSNVKSNIAGTTEAKEAILESHIPQTAEVDRNSATLETAYDGDPVFEAIDGTEMRYATNTDKAVINVNNYYYCCDNAVWFESQYPTHGWKVATKIPEQVRLIPPKCPIYNVKYVYIYDFNDNYVRTGYIQGYVHNYVYHGCVFYGTGYRYKPWYRTVCYMRPTTYGYGAHYNSYTGWGFSYGSSYGGYSWITYGYKYRYGNSSYGYYTNYWGPSGYRYEYYRNANIGSKRGYYDQRKAKEITKSAPKVGFASNNIYTKRNDGITRTGNIQMDPKTGKVISGSTSVRQAQTSRQKNNIYSSETGDVYKRKNNGKWVEQSNKTTSSERRSTTPASTKTTSSSTTSSSSSRSSGSSVSLPKSTTSTGNTTTKTATSSSTERRSSTPASTQTTTSTTSSTSRSSGSSVSQPKSTSTNTSASSTRSNLEKQSESRTRSGERNQTYSKNKSTLQYSQPATNTRTSSSARSSSSSSKSSTTTTTKTTSSKSSSATRGGRSTSTGK